MAVDTAQKRFSMLTIDNFDELLFQADGAVDGDDRAHLVGLYSGIPLDAPIVVIGRPGGSNKEGRVPDQIDFTRGRRLVGPRVVPTVYKGGLSDKVAFVKSRSKPMHRR